MNLSLFRCAENLSEAAAVIAATSGEVKSLGDKNTLKEQCSLCAGKAKDYRSRYETALQNYGDTFGEPARGNGDASPAGLEAAEYCVEDTRTMNLVYDPPKGFLSRKLKIEAYNAFCQSAILLSRHYEQCVDEMSAYSSSKYDIIPQEAAEFLSMARVCESNAAEDAWEQPEQKALSDDLYLGALELPLDATEELPKALPGYVAHHGKEDWLKIPYSYRGGDGFSLLIEEEGRGEKTKHLLRSVIYQILRGMKPYTYRILYIDPTGAGSTLGELLEKLRTVKDGNAFHINSQLYHNQYQLLDVKTVFGEVRDCLTSVESQIGTINSIRGDKTVAQYNASITDEEGNPVSEAAGTICHTFVIYENIGDGLQDTELQQLKKMITSADACGLSLILTRSTTEDYSGNDDRRKRTEAAINDLLSAGMDRLVLSENGSWISFAASKNERKNFNFREMAEPVKHEDFLKSFCDSFHTTISVDSTITTWMNVDEEWGKYDSSHGIEVPIGIDSRGKVQSIRIGTSEYAHAILAGTNGCGKSSLLHTIINSIIMRYRPDDVQIWFSDYKQVEARQYFEKTPPHIRYLAAASTFEYSLSFLDRLYAEYERRVAMLGSLPNILEYRKKNGLYSMPRLLIVMDEFHKMSDHCKEVPEYKTKLTNLLKESRATGMTFLLSDQTIAVGLGGLSEEAKKQLTCRMSMRQVEMDEYNAAFGISNAKDILPVLQPKEILIKRSVRTVDDWGKESTGYFYEHDKTLFIPLELRGEFANRSIRDYPEQCGRAVIVRDAERIRPDRTVLQKEKERYPKDVRPLFLGMPTRGGRPLPVQLHPGPNENILCVTPDSFLQTSLLLEMLEGCQGNDDHEIYVLASKYDDLYRKTAGWLQEQSQKDFHFSVFTDAEDICRTVIQLKGEYDLRRKQGEGSPVFVVWIGVNDILMDMSTFPAKCTADTTTIGATPKADADVLNKIQQGMDLLASLGDLFADDDEEETVKPEQPVSVPKPEDEEVSFCYNAASDMAALIQNAPQKGIHTILFASANSILKQFRQTTKMEYFKHRIANCISDDDAELVGNTKNNHAAQGGALESDVAVYYNGITGYRFKPFMTETETMLREANLMMEDENGY